MSLIEDLRCIKIPEIELAGWQEPYIFSSIPISPKQRRNSREVLPSPSRLRGATKVCDRLQIVCCGRAPAGPMRGEKEFSVYWCCGFPIPLQSRVPGDDILREHNVVRARVIRTRNGGLICHDPNP